MRHISFKHLLISVIVSCLICVTIPTFAVIQKNQQVSVEKKLEELESSTSGRLGITAVDTSNNTRIEYHANQRFPMCSTNKLMGVAAILKKSMTNSHLLEQKVIYNKKDLVVYSPVTKKFTGLGMKISALCKAAMTLSDNTAINLLMKKLGGLKAVNAFAHSIGDHAFRLDRFEPELNTAIPGDIRDTTTPAAMEKSLRQLALGNVLASPQRKQLQTWLKQNTTGYSRIRAGVPKGWIVGDKTGTGDYGTTNDIGIIWPPNCSPIVVAIYFTQSNKNASPRSEIIASVTRLLINSFAQTDRCMKLKQP